MHDTNQIYIFPRIKDIQNRMMIKIILIDMKIMMVNAQIYVDIYILYTIVIIITIILYTCLLSIIVVYAILCYMFAMSNEFG